MANLNLTVLLTLSFLFGVLAVPGQGSNAAKKEKLTGTVIAENRFAHLLCVYHPCSMVLLVRLDSRDGSPSKIVQVVVEYFPDSSKSGGIPAELLRDSARWKFRAIREHKDIKVEQSVTATNVDTKVTSQVSANVWVPLPNVTDAEIPVGRVVPSYFVKTGEYKKQR
jgi:hypothetical protein